MITRSAEDSAQDLKCQALPARSLPPLAGSSNVMWRIEVSNPNRLCPLAMSEGWGWRRKSVAAAFLDCVTL